MKKQIRQIFELWLIWMSLFFNFIEWCRKIIFWYFLNVCFSYPTYQCLVPYSIWNSTQALSICVVVERSNSSSHGAKGRRFESQPFRLFFATVRRFHYKTRREDEQTSNYETTVKTRKAGAAKKKWKDRQANKWTHLIT